MSSRWRYGLLLASVALTGCQPKDAVPKAAPASAASAPASDPDTFMASSRGVNYDREYAIRYTLYWLDGNKKDAVGGSNVGPFEDSGQNCCVSLSRIWRPGLAVQVDIEWMEIAGDAGDEKTSKVYPIPEYRQPGDLYLLFHSGKQLELMVSAHEPGTPGWAGREQLTPLEACVARHGKKECMKNFPKYPGNSNEAFAERMRRNCTPDALKGSSNENGDRAACERMQKECREKWIISDKKMCELDYMEQE
ncbi:DUF3304 domain-containing protein [Chitiniphilus purpureus]|uniref:DUF3304 domain-containing protein n=1 Tax=Chitiniphilus purpureus TaxID=2981137 RepID=A0ABY6DTE3_9NEIS|nr:DUF3304 domain-containing protein [Chitiniphilus sp. CD1]UXY15133.1 DUF3304 domain-containing protein [Chitiniphilus sp. CD1]